ncbi:hypothetical protein FIBSPDRAFT_153386 [Athelia psychrophila]|uniref:Uncharacterized protein n=1 Tax=Athelia psychrophila TaxID=1759441 RepID=A0A166BHS3_9AGAM|nr:hypothetical protein FIBSPDRAFT_153386 [Fibularhizoctonia sp. CBS 109695]
MTRTIVKIGAQCDVAAPKFCNETTRHCLSHLHAGVDDGVQGEGTWKKEKGDILELTVNAILDLNPIRQIPSALFCHSEADGKDARADESPHSRGPFSGRARESSGRLVHGPRKDSSMIRRAFSIEGGCGKKEASPKSSIYVDPPMLWNIR